MRKKEDSSSSSSAPQSFPAIFQPRLQRAAESTPSRPGGGSGRASERGREERARPAGGGGRSSGPGLPQGRWLRGRGLAAPARAGGRTPHHFAAQNLTARPAPAAPRRQQTACSRVAVPQPSSPMPAQQCGQPPASARTNHVALALGGPCEATCSCTAGETEAGPAGSCVCNLRVLQPREEKALEACISQLKLIC